MNLMPTLISIGLGISISFLYLQNQKDEPNKINYRAALSEFEQSALAFAAKTQLDANNPQPQSFCQNMNFEFGSKLAAGSQWEIDITGLDCDIALLSLTTAKANDFKILVSAATESGRAQDAEIDYNTRKISWTQRIYNRKASDLGFKAKIKNNTLGSCIAGPCNQTNSLTSSTQQALKAGWSDYGNWSSCYRGSQQRTRVCINANPQIRLFCPGSDTDSRSCNRPPTAQNLIISAVENTPKTITLMGNDPDSDPLQYTISSKGSGKIIHAKGANTVSYISQSETETSDQFTYRVCDNSNSCSREATVTVQITLVDDPPSAKSFTLKADEQKLTTFNLEGTDPEKQRLEYYITSNPQNGEARNTHEYATYKSLSDTATKDQFTYKACDNSSCSKATVNVLINPINDAPTARDNTAYVEEGKKITIYLHGADVDSDVNELTYTITQAPSGEYRQKGHVLNYTALKDQPIPWGASSKQEVDRLHYKVCDDKACSAAATISIKTTQINAAPWFESITPKEQRATATVGTDYSYEFTIIDTDYVFGGNKQEEVTFTMPSWLKIEKNSEILSNQIYKAKLVGSPQREDINSFNNSIVITAKDGWWLALENFTINVKPPIPPANDQSVEVAEGDTVDIMLGTVNMGGYSLIYKIIDQPDYGTLSNRRTSFNNLFITYRSPTYMFKTQDSFKFEVCDLDICSDEPGTVTIKFIKKE